MDDLQDSMANDNLIVLELENQRVVEMFIDGSKLLGVRGDKHLDDSD